MKPKRPICVLTGASKGIGFATAELLSGDYDIIGVARRRPAHWAGQFVECDLANRSDVEALCNTIEQQAAIWALVNNAGFGVTGSLASSTRDDAVAAFELNSVVPILLARSAALRMTSGGRIVNICSTAMNGKAERGVYGASKAALASLSKTWALELAPRGITVNAIAPGPIDTELFRTRTPKGSSAEREIMARIPLGRLGTPEQVAEVIRFFLSPMQSYVTGQVLQVDGGLTLGAVLL